MANISTIKVGSTSYGLTPASHASTATTYGAATDSNYGHVKLSDNYTSSAGAAASGIGASSLAVCDAYNTLNSNNGLVLGPGTYNMKCYYVTSTYSGGTVYSGRYPMLYTGTGQEGFSGTYEFGMISLGGYRELAVAKQRFNSGYPNTSAISITFGTVSLSNNVASFTMTIPTNACVYTSRKNLTGDA